MAIEYALWATFAVTVVYYIWVGKVYVSQPKFNRPRLFWNPAVAMILANVPFLGFIGVTVAGFFFTEHGWWFLGASILAFFAFSTKPQAF